MASNMMESGSLEKCMELEGIQILRVRVEFMYGKRELGRPNMKNQSHDSFKYNLYIFYYTFFIFII
jgi:hypothetical protein